MLHFIQTQVDINLTCSFHCSSGDVHDGDGDDGDDGDDDALSLQLQQQ